VRADGWAAGRVRAIVDLQLMADIGLFDKGHLIGRLEFPQGLQGSATLVLCLDVRRR
jgi:hypothetical protein